MNDLFGNEIKESNEFKTTRGNPLLSVYGVSEGNICKNCIHLWRKRRSRTYLKCDMVEMTNGAGTDWKAKWQACGKFKPNIG